jgi:hypothetical protein
MLATGQQSAVPNQAAGGLVVAACFVIHAVTIGQMTSTARNNKPALKRGVDLFGGHGGQWCGAKSSDPCA